MRRISVKRIYEPAAPEDGYRVLVDRLWPRGLSKQDATLDHWARDLAPSTALRKWFHQDTSRWTTFRERYFQELDGHSEALRTLLEQAGERPMTLLFAAKDTERNHAILLRERLCRL